jgi:histidine triad (HIT) family protein
MYTHAPQIYACPFCLIVGGIENQDVLSVQSDVIYRDQHVTYTETPNQTRQSSVF